MLAATPSNGTANLPTGQSRRWSSIMLAVSLALCPFMLQPGTGSATDIDPSSLIASVDSARMMDTVADLQAFGSREFHLESSREAAQYIYDELLGIVPEVELQTFTVDGLEVVNVIGTIEGTDEGSSMYLFGAHYDSENSAAVNLSTAENLTAPGADDDASGVAAVLEIARAVSATGFPATVKFVLFGAEEYGYDNSGGCKGSEYFVSVEKESGHTYEATAILDMIGYRTGESNRAVVVVNEDGCSLAKPTLSAVDTHDIDLDFDLLEMSGVTYSDHGSFWEAGFPSMLVTEELDDVRHYPVNPFYHTSYDTMASISQDQMEAVTKALLAGLAGAVDNHDIDLLLFGTAIMSATIVSLALIVHFRRRRGRAGDDRRQQEGT